MLNLGSVELLLAGFILIGCSFISPVIEVLRAPLKFAILLLFWRSSYRSNGMPLPFTNRSKTHSDLVKTVSTIKDEDLDYMIRRILCIFGTMLIMMGTASIYIHYGLSHHLFEPIAGPPLSWSETPTRR